MSIKGFQHKQIRSSQKLFMLGVTTFGAMLVFVNAPQFTTTVHADSETTTVSQVQDINSDQQTSLETNTNSSENNSDLDSRTQTINPNKNQAATVQTDVPQATSNVQESVKTNRTTVNTYTAPVKTTVSAPKATENNNTDQNSKVRVQNTATNSNTVKTVIGNTVTDTQNYQAIQKTADSMNNSSVQIDQAYFGTTEDKMVNQQLTAMGETTPTDLKENGYLIKSGVIDNKKTLIVQGKDSTGLFYAINNLNNLISQKNNLQKVNISESPQMPIRGVIEGFYGQPWSQTARKDLFKFMGEHKMNFYIYSPKDDDYLRKNWRELYPQDKLDEIKDLVNAAKKNHVSFVYTLSPGNDITYSSEKDFAATTAKLDQLRSIGVDQFYIALDDIPLGMTAQDAIKFPNHATPNYPKNSWSGLADAQAFYVNKVQRDYVKKNNLPNLWFVPTNYNGSKQDPFKEAQGLLLDKDIILQWTGEGVFSPDITTESVEQAKKTYHVNHLFIWDNFPVNDSDQDRLYLNPLEGRSKKLYQTMDGFTSNPMIQPYASWIGLAGYGDYMWNADKYSPSYTQQSIIHELAGKNPDALAALQAFVDLNQYWDYAAENNKYNAPILSIFVNNFENASYGTAEYAAAKQRLIDHLNVIANAPETLQNMAVTGFYNDSLPWINAASHWAKASLAAINITDAINSGQTDSSNLGNNFAELDSQVELANKKALPDSRTGNDELLITPSVGDGVFQKFVDKAYEATNKWLGGASLETDSTKLSSTATTDIPQNGDNSAANMSDGDLNTKFWSNRSIKTGDTIKIALNDTEEIQRLVLRQGTSDEATSGDILQKATIYAGTKEDGSDKVEIGQITPNGLYQLDLNQPTKAKYLFITATSQTDNWLQIRDISIYGKTGLGISNIQTSNNSGSQAIFDNNVKTSFTGKLVDSNNEGSIEQSVKPIVGAKNIYVVGHVNGTVYVHSNGEWINSGRVTADKAINQISVKSDSIDGIKLVIDKNSEEFTINEFGLSN